MRRVCILLGMALVLVQPAEAQVSSDSWVAQKCAAYEAGWTQALEMFGSDQMNFAFVAGNENFIASDCAERGSICPRSRQELDVANALTLALMNAGAASTFLPFHCERPDAVEGGWSGPGL